MFRTLAFTVAMMVGVNAFALAPVKKIAAPKVISELTKAPTYLDGMTNEKYATGSNSFSLPLKKDGSEEMRASLRLNAGAGADTNAPSASPQKLHMSVFHIANKKTTESMRLSFKGLKASLVGTRVLTFEGPAKSNEGAGRLVAKVQQEQLNSQQWKTTGTVVQFVPAGSNF
ncbi:MAG: hypothetical protein EOP05_05875 [Proteobacteria bacterium]|nr:MAG: hypothetical protein EOP05_05875 [Pseudomonadota bacterium]